MEFSEYSALHISEAQYSDGSFKDIENKVETEEVEETGEVSEVDELNAKIAELEAQIAERDDTILRKIAEFENFKRRENQNKDKLTEFVKANTLKELLPSIDNIERALSADDSAVDYAKGVSMTVKGLLDALTKIGLEEINPENQPFDVDFHQAIMKVEDESVGENTVVEVLQKGYKLGDTVLRYAMVKVANCD